MEGLGRGVDGSGMTPIWIKLPGRHLLKNALPDTTPGIDAKLFHATALQGFGGLPYGLTITIVELLFH
jgi:hypothetical protein